MDHGDCVVNNRRSDVANNGWLYDIGRRRRILSPRFARSASCRPAAPLGILKKQSEAIRRRFDRSY
jgi:hypothetical protein